MGHGMPQNCQGEGTASSSGGREVRLDEFWKSVSLTYFIGENPRLGLLNSLPVCTNLGASASSCIRNRSNPYGILLIQISDNITDFMIPDPYERVN